MYVFNLANKLILNKILLHFIVVIQFVASFFVMEYAVSDMHLSTSASNYMGDILESNFCYFSVAERANIFIDENGNVSEIGSSEYFEDNLKDYEVIVQNDALALKLNNKNTEAHLQSFKVLEQTKPKLYKGKIFTHQNYEQGYIRMITNDKSFRVGEYYKAIKTDVSGTVMEIPIKIVGVYTNPAYNMNTSGGGSDMAAPHIATVMDNFSSRDNMFASIICLEDYEKYTGEKLKHPLNKNAIILFKDDISKDSLKENMAFLKSRGVISNSKEIMTATKNLNSYIISQNLPTFIFLMLVSIIGIIAVSTVNITEQTRTLSLYAVMGCSKKDLYKIIYCYIGILCVVPIIIVLIILALSKYIPSLSVSFSQITLLNYILPIIVGATVCLLSSAIPIRNIKKQDIITSIHSKN